MKKVRIADLKAHLSEHLRSVRDGRTLTVLDRDTPVAQIVPFERDAGLQIRRASGSPKAITLQRPAGRTDSLTVLLQDRAKR